MAIIEYRKVQCDNCGKTEEIKEGGSHPSNWFELNIVQWTGTTGYGRWTKEVCSEKCALEIMKKLKKIPKPPIYI